MTKYRDDLGSFLLIARALGDETRARAVLALRDGELCLCQLIELLGLAPATVSKHMSVLQRAGLVERRKEGRWHYYRLATARGAARVVSQALRWAIRSLRADDRIEGDAAVLERVRRADLEELSACYRG